MYDLFPQTFEYALLHGKGELNCQIELMLLICCPENKEVILDYSNGPNVTMRKKEAKVARVRQCVQEMAHKYWRKVE
jgi:hypothetical protein